MRNSEISSWSSRFSGPTNPVGDKPSGDIVKIDSSHLLEQMLNILDFGAFVINRQCELIKASSRAKTSFCHHLRLGTPGETVFPLDDSRQLAWSTAVNIASLGNGQFIELGSAQPPELVRLQSIDIGMPLGWGMAILVCGSRPATANDAALRAYARAARLTPTQSHTLTLIVNGHSPVEIANIRGVSEYTVRAQIKDIYRRTHTRTVRELLISVGILPPVAAKDGH